jgi:hypothetical protein
LQNAGGAALTSSCDITTPCNPCGRLDTAETLLLGHTNTLINHANTHATESSLTALKATVTALQATVIAQGLTINLNAAATIANADAIAAAATARSGLSADITALGAANVVAAAARSALQIGVATNAASIANQALGLTWESNVGEIDGSYYVPFNAAVGSAEGNGAAIKHVFMGDFDVVIKSTGNAHLGTGMMFGPLITNDDQITDYCDFNLA